MLEEQHVVVLGAHVWPEPACTFKGRVREARGMHLAPAYVGCFTQWVQVLWCIGASCEEVHIHCGMVCAMQCAEETQVGRRSLWVERRIALDHDHERRGAAPTLGLPHVLNLLLMFAMHGVALAGFSSAHPHTLFLRSMPCASNIRDHMPLFPLHSLTLALTPRVCLTESCLVHGVLFQRPLLPLLHAHPLTFHHGAEALDVSMPCAFLVVHARALFLTRHRSVFQQHAQTVSALSVHSRAGPVHHVFVLLGH